MDFIKRNKLLVVGVVSFIVLWMISPASGQMAGSSALDNLKTVGMVLPPIFVLIGLLDVWVPKETMVKYMGKGSGLKGGLIAVFLGAVGAGPLVVAFPIAALLIRKGARLAYVFLFLGAWTSVKLPLFMFELASLGPQFTFTHVITSMIVYFVGAVVLEKILSADAVEVIVEKSKKIA